MSLTPLAFSIVLVSSSRVSVSLDDRIFSWDALTNNQGINSWAHLKRETIQPLRWFHWVYVPFQLERLSLLTPLMTPHHSNHASYSGLQRICTHHVRKRTREVESTRFVLTHGAVLVRHAFDIESFLAGILMGPCGILGSLGSLSLQACKL